MAGMSASFSRGHCAYHHDVRLTHTNNVDISLTKDNVILCDLLQGRSIKDYTNEVMQPSIDRYNEGQRRKDRRIDTDYVTWHNSQTNPSDLAYEFVAQLGEHESLGVGYYNAASDIEKAELREFFIGSYEKLLEDMRKSFPHLTILYAVIHFDEPNGTPHLHLCVQGIGKEYARGLKERVSIGRALTLDGIDRCKTRVSGMEQGFQLERFYANRRDFLKEILVERGFDLKPEEHGHPHIPAPLYNAHCGELAVETKLLQRERDQARAERDMYSKQIELVPMPDVGDLKTNRKGYIKGRQVKAEDYDTMVRRGRVDGDLLVKAWNIEKDKAIVSRSLDEYEREAESAADKVIDRYLKEDRVVEALSSERNMYLTAFLEDNYPDVLERFNFEYDPIFQEQEAEIKKSFNQQLHEQTDLSPVFRRVERKLNTKAVRHRQDIGE